MPASDRPGPPPPSASGRGWAALAALLVCLPAAAQAAPGTQTASPAPALPEAPSAIRSAPPASANLLPGSIAGLVTDTAGALIGGARITLFRADGAAVSQTLSDGSGNFLLSHVAPGAFTVSVTLPGFLPAQVSDVLAPGQTQQLKPFALSMATVNFSVDAVTYSPELAAQQLHAEEQQRLIGLLPNFYVSYDFDAQPLTPKQKFTLAWKNASDPGNLFLVGTVAGVEQAENAFPGYGQGAAGYGRRYGAALGNLVSGTFMGGAILPVLFHQDPRFFYKGTGSVRSRFWYAVTRAVVARGDNGRWQPAYAGVLGDLSAGAISNLYYAPSDRQGAALTLENGFLGVAGDAMNGVVQEFFLNKLTKKGK